MAGKLQLSPVVIRPRDILKSVHDTFIRTAEDKCIKLNMLVAEDIPEYMIGDPARIRQVLFNLVGQRHHKFTETDRIGHLGGLLFDQRQFRILPTAFFL